MTLEARPISSIISLGWHSTPSSSRAVRDRMTMRSHSGCSTASIRAPVRCFRSSIQNIGGLSGFSYFSLVKFSREPEPAAEMSSRRAPSCVYTDSRSVSRAGCCTLSILAPVNAAASSSVKPLSSGASSGMGGHSFSSCKIQRRLAVSCIRRRASLPFNSPAP